MNLSHGPPRFSLGMGGRAGHRRIVWNGREDT